MPIFKFHGLNEEQVSDYYNKVEEISEIAVADINRIVFIAEKNTKIFSANNDAIYITIDWMSRPDKQEKIAKHIVSHFENFSKNIFVKFEELNGLLYFNGNLVG